MDNKENVKTNVFSLRNFQLIFFGSLISEIGAVLYSFAVSFYILQITQNNAFLQGLYLALSSVALLLVTPLGGVFGDRYNKVKIIYLCDYLKGALIIVSTILMLLFREPSNHVVILFTVGIIGNIISGFFSPASSALLPAIVAPEQFQQANSYFTIKNSLNSIFGVVLAGVLYAALPIHILFFAVGICFILSAISEMFVKYDYVPSDSSMTVRVILQDMKSGLVYLNDQKPIMVLMGAILFINFFFTPITGNFLPYFISTDVASAESYIFDNVLTPEMWSSVFSVLIAVFSLIGAAVMSVRQSTDKVGRKVAVMIMMIAAVMIIMSAGYKILIVDRGSINGYLLLICGFCCAIGFLLPSINIPISTAIMTTVESNMLSKVMGLINVLSQGLIPLSSVMAGAILQNGGILPLLLASTAGFTLTAVFMLVNRNIKEI